MCKHIIFYVLWMSTDIVYPCLFFMCFEWVHCVYWFFFNIQMKVTNPEYYNDVEDGCYVLIKDSKHRLQQQNQYTAMFYNGPNMFLQTWLVYLYMYVRATEISRGHSSLLLLKKKWCCFYVFCTEFKVIITCISTQNSS